jgi:hypothetical protein
VDDVTRYRVRITVPRASGYREWNAARVRFKERLAAQEGCRLIAAEIESETRRGRDYVRVTISAAVDAVNIAEALDIAWDAFEYAVGDDTAGWVAASASAEVRPEAPPLTRRMVRSRSGGRRAHVRREAANSPTVGPNNWE